ncbi:MAG: hypothetical protein ACREPR_00615 [Brasilonema sp.]
MSQWQRDNFYLYGVVEPLSGYSFFYEFSHLDGDCFQKFLELLSVELGDDVAVIQFDHRISSRHELRSFLSIKIFFPIFLISMLFSLLRQR